MLATPPPPAAAPACGPGCVAAVSPAELFRLADDLRAAGRDADADAALRALFADADGDVRREARFRLARSLVARARYAEAIALLERLLAERPGAAPARLELARALELSGDHPRSLREFARLQAGALPADLAREVDRVVSTLRSARPFGGSLEVGLAPDSNANQATAATAVLVGGLPFALDRSARARAGLGLETAGQLFWRLPLSGTTRLVVDAVGRGTLYRDHALDGGDAELSVGPEFAGRLRPALFGARRWYAGRGYAWSWGGTGQWLHPVSRRTVLDLDARVERTAVERSRAADGTGTTLSAAVERALRPALFVRLSAFGTRYAARSPAFSTTAGGAALLVARDFGPVSLYGQAGWSRLSAPASPLGGARRDNRVDLAAGLSVRRLRLLGASPVLRISHGRNASTAVLYDTTRTRVEAALSRPF